LAAESLVQIAQQFPDTPTARWSLGVTAEHVDEDGRRAPAGLLDVAGTDISIVVRHELGRSRRVGRCSQNVLHLVGVGQWMQVRGGCRTHRRSRRVARRHGVRVSGRPERRQRGNAQRLSTFATARERPCRVDRVSGSRVGRVRSLEDLQDFLRALNGITGDLAKVLLAQHDLIGLVHHGAILVHHT